MPRVRLLVLGAVGLVLGLSCKSETEPEQPVPTTLTLNRTTVALGALGATDQLTATVLDQNGSAMSGADVTWASDATSVASVSGSGLVTAVANGMATITASVASLQQPVAVTVQQVGTQLAKAAGDGQTGPVGQPLATTLEVELRDARNNAVAGGTGDVTFVVAAGGGSVSQATVPLGGNGRASTSWTLGTVAGDAQSLSATLVGGSITTSFGASAVAGPASAIALVSGNGQTGGQGSTLSDSLIVEVLDEFGNVVAGHTVNWVATSGNGSVSPSSGPTGTDGRAATEWTLGAGTGTQTAEAQAGGITGSPVAFSATSVTLTITAVSPDPLVEGASATIDGDGFSSTPANNTVMIGGVAAAVTAASVNQLTVTVPTYDCQPARDVSVRVTVGGANSNTVTQRLNPAQFVSLGVGEQLIATDPALFCFQFAPSLAPEAYLIGIQSTSETVSNLTAVRLAASTGAATQPPPSMLPAVQGPAYGVSDVVDVDSERVSRWHQHRLAEQQVRKADLQALASGLVTTRAQMAQLVDSNVAVGDTIKTIRVWDRASNCTGFEALTVVVRAKGLRGIWLEDVANPLNGYTVADFDSLSRYLDNVIFDADTSYFGDPGDIDENARIVIVVTKEINATAGLLGFVGSCDFFPRTSAPASNEGEFFYARAPDPTGTFGAVYSRNDAFADAPFLIAHEFTHIIQLGRRLPTAKPFTRWILEGQATLAEELVGHVVTGRSEGQNYGFAVAFNSPATADIDWYSNAFVDLAVYFGFNLSSGKVANAPHECSWIDLQSFGNDGPCIHGRDVYGVPWSLLRWASEQYGGALGGTRGIQRAIVESAEAGLATLEDVLGVRADTLLAQWAASLYVDDRVLGADATLLQMGWNLFDIFEVNRPAAWRLTPREHAFGAIDDPLNVRAGSSAYFRVSGTGRPATAVGARDQAGGVLPSTMRYWIVRLQ